MAGGLVPPDRGGFNRSADTHLIRIELPRFPAVKRYLKDESSHPMVRCAG